MDFLFKTTLSHLKKNSLIVSVLSFFVASGTAVLSSVDHLSSNLNKGFEDINFDSNPHDLVLVSKSFKPTQKFDITPEYLLGETEKLVLRPKWGYRWAWNNLNDSFYVETKDLGALTKDSNGAPSSPSGKASSQQSGFTKLDRQNFYIPTGTPENLHVDNKWVICYYSDTFFSNTEKIVFWADRNAAGFKPDKDHPFTLNANALNEQLQYKCPRSSEGGNFGVDGKTFLRSALEYYRTQIVKKEAQITKGIDIARLHSDSKSVIPRRFWVYSTDDGTGTQDPSQKAGVSKDPNLYIPFIESDFYFDVDLKFKAMMKTDDVIGKFEKLVESMSADNVFHMLDTETKRSVAAFRESPLFKTSDVRFYANSASSVIETWDVTLPAVDGLSFWDMSAIVFKLFVWNLLDGSKVQDSSAELSKDKQKQVNLSDWNWPKKQIEEEVKEPKQQPQEETREQKNTSKEEENEEKTDAPAEDKSEIIKKKFKESISSWGNTQGIEGWKILEDFGELETSGSKQQKEHDKKPDKSEKYILSTVKAGKKVSDLKSESKASDDNDNYSKDDKIYEAVKKVLEKWISGETTNLKGISKPQPPGGTSSTSQTPPNALPITSFEETYQTLFRSFFERFFLYTNTLRANNLKRVRSFINEHEIFTLSFLLNKYIYTDNGSKSRLKLTSNTAQQNDDDHLLSVNYHQSLVVTNSHTASAKLNDETKTGHSFKIISQQRKNDATVNRVKIVSGNPLFTEYQDLLNVLSDAIAIQKDEPQSFQTSSYASRNFFRTLARMKYDDPVFQKIARSLDEYVSSKYDDPWNSGSWLSFENGEKWRIWRQGLVRDNQKFISRGSRIFGTIKNVTDVFLTRTTPKPISAKLTELPKIGYIDRFSSFFTVVSPLYAKRNNITPISDEQYQNFKRIVEGDTATQEEFENAYNSFILDPQNHDHIINVNGNKLIVVGTGTSPDMVLPSHSLFNLVPNKDKEALLFVDTRGYERIKYNSLSTWDEFYLSLSYPQAIKDFKQEAEYKKDLQNYIGQFLWGGPWDDDNPHVELASVKSPSSRQLVFMRSNYVDNFLYSVHSLSTVILTALAAICLFTVWTLIKKYVASSLNTFGVFIANGIQRNKIILNSISFVLIPALVGTVIGYLIALSIQPLLFSLISEIWYLSPVFSGFSLSTMLYYVMVTASILSPISALAAYMLLRGNANQLMKVNTSFKSNKFVEWIYGLFNNFPSLWKFRASVILNTAGRGLVLSSATVFLFVFSSFLFNNLGQFAAVSNYEMGVKDFGYSLTFDTPTDQSGQPTLASYMNIGDSFEDPTAHTKTVVLRDKDGKLISQDVEFSHQNPELVAKGIHSVFMPKDITKFFETCNHSVSDIDKFRQKLGVMDYDYIGNAFVETTYNVYLFANSLNAKTDQGDAQIDCSTATKKLTDHFNRQEFKLPSSKVREIWEKSMVLNPGTNVAVGGAQQQQGAQDNNSNKIFNPSSTTEVPALGQYVPVENEDWSDSGKKQEKFGEEALFKPLLEYYKGKGPFYSKASKQETTADKQGQSSTSSYISYQFADENTKGKSNSTENGDFTKVKDNNNADVEHPNLKRLFKDSSNYWFLAYDNIASISDHPTFMKNKILMPILFNHNWSIDVYGTSLTFNPWAEFSDFFSKYSPELVASMNDNYVSFIQDLIKSRYGAYFVKRFMTKHNSPKSQSPSSTNDESHVPGKEYYGKPTWYVGPNVVHEKNKQSIPESGLYWLDANKMIYVYAKVKSEAGASASTTESQKHSDSFIIFRPDFLYLFFAIMKDKEFLTKSRAPVKVAFHQNLYVPEKDKPYDEWKITGDVNTDTQQNKGLTAVDSSVTEADYRKTPEGDQTYTYLDVEIPGISNAVRPKIFGLKQDKRGSFIKLLNKGEIINQKLYTDKGEDNSYPVIINHYTARKLKLDVGSTFDVHVHNTTDRYTKHLKGESPTKTVKLRVADIHDSFFNLSIYISQKHANEIIGLNPDYGYNGMYAAKETYARLLPRQVTQVISGFSASGIYTKTRIKKNSEEFLDFLKKKPSVIPARNEDHKLMPPINHEFLLHKWKVNDVESLKDVNSFAGALEQAFVSEEGFALNSSIVAVDNAALFNNFIFSTVSDLIISVVNLFMVIFTPLLICSLLTITSLIVEDLKNLLTILNLLGFTYVENSVTILLYLGLILGFSTLVALPVSSLMLGLYVNGVFNTLSVYLPVYLRADYAIASFSAILAMFGYSYWKCMRKIKSLYLPVAMKSINE